MTSYPLSVKLSPLDRLAPTLFSPEHCFFDQNSQPKHAQHAYTHRNAGHSRRSSVCRPWTLFPPFSWIWTCTHSRQLGCLLGVQEFQHRRYVCFHPTRLLHYVQGSVVYLQRRLLVRQLHGAADSHEPWTSEATSLPSNRKQMLNCANV
jgi:hypothetical protein